MLTVESAADGSIIGCVDFPTRELLSLLLQYALSAQRNINLRHSNKASPFSFRKEWTAFTKHRVHVRSITKAASPHRPAERIGKTNSFTALRGRVARHHR